MKIDPYRLLSFAFASADLFLEITPDGTVGLALGAAQKVCGRTEAGLAGLDWRQIVCPRDQAMVEALLASLGAAERRGPFSIGVMDAAGKLRHVSFSLGRLPPLATVSMSLSLAIPDTASFAGSLLDGHEFARQAERALAKAANAGKALEVSLVEMSGLQSVREAMSQADAKVLDEKIVGAVRAQAYGGALAGQLGPESYALVRPETESEAQLTERLNLSLRAMVSELCGVTAVARPFSSPAGAAPANPALALKRAVDAVARHGPANGESLADAFAKSVEKTLSQAAAFQSAVAAGRFRLAFQPIVALATGALHHYEVLVRFNDGKSPLDTIVLAEELNLIEALDRAVLGEAMKVLNAPAARLKLAVNISGRSIANPEFMQALQAASRKVRGPKEALIFEVTESSKIEDFDAVDRHIGQLRAAGHLVCLDDFGAGAASLAYLQRLRVDVVKVDGQYIKALGDPRERAMVGHVVQMCRDLGVQTIAEMIETDEIAAAARDLGFDYGQGYLFGHPASEPQPLKVLTAPSPAGRRRGVVETWG